MVEVGLRHDPGQAMEIALTGLVNAAAVAVTMKVVLLWAWMEMEGQGKLLEGKWVEGGRGRRLRGEDEDEDEEVHGPGDGPLTFGGRIGFI